MSEQKTTIQAGESAAAILALMGFRKVSLRDSNYLVFSTPLRAGKSALVVALEQALQRAADEHFPAPGSIPGTFVGLCPQPHASEEGKAAPGTTSRNSGMEDSATMVIRNGMRVIGAEPSPTRHAGMKNTQPTLDALWNHVESAIELASEYGWGPHLIHGPISHLRARLAGAEGCLDLGQPRVTPIPGSSAEMAVRFYDLMNPHKDLHAERAADHEALLQQFRETKALLEKTTEERDQAITSAEHLASQVLSLSKAHDQTTDMLKDIRIILIKSGAL